jgi:hypothetical protein
MPSRITVLKVKREHDRQMINEEDRSAELHLDQKLVWVCVRSLTVKLVQTDV